MTRRSGPFAGPFPGALSGLGTAGAAALRIGDAERESAVAALGEHFAAGRLSHEEFDERSGRAWGARTAGELGPLFADLPHPHPGAAHGSPPRAWSGFAGEPTWTSRRHRGPRFRLLPVLALALVVAMLTPVPFLVVVLTAWLGFVWLVRPGLSRWHGGGHPHGVRHGCHTSGSRRAVRGTWS